MVHQKKGGLTVFSPILDRFSRIPTKSVLFATSFTAVLCWLAVCMISRNPGTHALPQVFFCAFVMLGCALICSGQISSRAPEDTSGLDFHYRYHPAADITDGRATV